jgi:hypothetical protein
MVAECRVIEILADHGNCRHHRHESRDLRHPAGCV